MIKKKSDAQMNDIRRAYFQLFYTIHNAHPISRSLEIQIIGKHTPFLKHLAFIGKQTAANGL